MFACPITPGLERLARKSNVILLGIVPHEKIPALLSLADYGVIPFVKNDLTKYVFPVKYLEYLAAGLKVITTYDLPEIQNLGEYDWREIAKKISNRLNLSSMVPAQSGTCNEDRV